MAGRGQRPKLPLLSCRPPIMYLPTGGGISSLGIAGPSLPADCCGVAEGGMPCVDCDPPAAEAAPPLTSTHAARGRFDWHPAERDLSCALAFGMAGTNGVPRFSAWRLARGSSPVGRPQMPRSLWMPIQSGRLVVAAIRRACLSSFWIASVLSSKPAEDSVSKTSSRLPVCCCTRR